MSDRRGRRKATTSALIVEWYCLFALRYPILLSMCTPLAAAFLRITALGLKGMVDVGTSKPPILWLLYY